MNTLIIELEQDIEYLECWLRNCDTQEEYEQAFKELCIAKTELAVIYDTAFSA